MMSAVARLIRSSALPSRLSLSSILLKRGNAFSSDATPGDPKRVEEPFKVEEAETVKVTPPSADKLLVLGGSGFVGSHVIKEALDKGFVVSSLNRSGKPSIGESWADKVTWNKGNLLEPASLKDAMDGISAVVSCVGGFGSNSVMYKINGTANINAIRAAAEKGIKRFVYVSAADFGLVNYLLQGYYEGKKANLPGAAVAKLICFGPLCCGQIILLAGGGHEREEREIGARRAADETSGETGRGKRRGQEEWGVGARRAVEWSGESGREQQQRSRHVVERRNR